MRNKYYMPLALLVALIAFLTYLPALKNGFVPEWDDGKMVLTPAIRSFDLDLLKWVFSTEANDTFGPLYVFSFAIDYALWGFNPIGYHLTSILLHSINAFLLFVILVRMCECRVNNSKSDNSNSNILVASFIVSLLFAVHPLNVSSVTWVSARNGPMSAIFFLGSIYYYLNYATGRRKAFLYKSLTLFVLATFSKPTTATLPAILLIIDYALLRRLTLGKRKMEKAKDVLVEKIPFILIGLFSLGTTAWIRHSTGFVAESEPLPIAMRIFVMVRALGFYLFNMAFPVNLAPLYAYPDNIKILNFEYLGSFALLTIITITCFYRRKNSFYLSLWFYYVIMLAPILLSLLLPSGTRRYAEADRYGYLACIGPFVLIGFGLSRYIEVCPKKVRKIIISIIIVMIGFLSVRTIDQISIWRNPVSLWSHQISIFPYTYEGYINRGTFFYRDGQYDKALQDFNKAIENGPDFADGYYNRGNVYSAIGKPDAAINDFTKAIELNPEDANTYCNRGNSFNSLGNFQQAIEDFTAAIRINPENADFYFNRGLSYIGIERFHDAIRDFNKAIVINPNDAYSHFYRGEAYSRIGKKADAEKDYRIADVLGFRK